MRPLFDLDHGTPKDWSERDLRLALALAATAVLLGGLVALLVEL